MIHKTISETVIFKLRDEILAGWFSPGEQLTAKKLSERFGCGLTPLREALSVLRSERLIENKRHKGVKVCKLDVDEIQMLLSG